MKTVDSKRPAKRRVVNLDTFAKETKEVSYSYPKTESDEDLVGFTTADYRKFADAYLRRAALAAAKASIKGVSTGVISKILGGYKVLPEFDIEKFKNRAAQDLAIIEKIKSFPPMFEFIKAQALEASEKASGVDSNVIEDDEDDDDEENG